MTKAATKTDPSGFYAFCAILDRAKARKLANPFAAARYAWKRAYQEECPFMEREIIPPAPEGIARLDFESCSELELTGTGGCGAHVYWEDSSTRVLCLAYKLPDFPSPVAWCPCDTGLVTGYDDEALTALFKWVRAGGLLEASNVEFERCAWARMVRDRDWPTVKPGQWRDSMALYCANGFPKALGKVAAALGVAEQKDAGGRALMLKMCKPAKPTKTMSDPWREHTPANLLALIDYCKQDVRTEEAVSTVLAELMPQELRVWQLTATMNDRGIPIDVFGAANLQELINRATAVWNDRIQVATGKLLTAESILSLPTVIDYCLSRGVHLTDVTKATVEKILAKTIPSDVRVVLESRQCLGKASTAKIQAMLNRTSADGRARGSLIYHGAGPGRWSGAGIQPQNLTKDKVDETVEKAEVQVVAVEDALDDVHRVVRGDMSLGMFDTLWGDPFQVAAGCIRGLLCAPKGKTFLVADYGQIEARVVMWLAGDPGLSLFASGADIYIETASVIYHKPASEIGKPSRERDLGKVTVLGGGFGMGAAEFFHRCQEMGIIITPEEAKACIDAYRLRFPRVPILWREVEKRAVQAVQNPKSVFLYRNIAYCFDGRDLRCRLPSGRKIVYPFAQIVMRPMPWDVNDIRPAVSYMGEVEHQWVREDTYGGKLTENFVQATARDIMAHAMFACEAAGLPVILTVHDEIICEVPAEGSMSVKAFESLICQLPPWAAGLPVKAEGWKGRRYRK